MNHLFEFRPDLGVRRLVPEWRALARREHLRADVVAGLTVASVAIPLSLAIALASGVAPALGLTTAIVASVVAALFGGTPLAVTGPAAAMAVLVASVVEAHGLGGLLVVGLVAGLLQVATGALGLGKLVRLVPVSVVEGFTAGIGAIILIGQMPRALGLPPPDESHVVDVLRHIGQLLHEAKPTSIAVNLATVALVLGLPFVSKKLPAPLLGVALPTIAVAVLGVDVATIGELPRSLPTPKLPTMPAGAAMAPLLASGVIVYAVASLETLLSSSAVDKLARGSQRHDPDQELVGQGLANVASALVGGVPVTGVIARSALNVQAGGKTRRAAIVHALALVAAVMLFAPALARIPVAALAGVLFSVAIRMLDPRKVLALAKVSRADVVVYVTTFLVIVGVGLLEGVQWGLVAALAIAAIRLGQSRARLSHEHADGGPARLVLSGPVTFLASLEVERARRRIEELARGAAAVLDLSGVREVDATGAEMIVDLVGTMRARDVRVAVFGLAPDVERRVRAADHASVLEGVLTHGQAEVAAALATPGAGLTARQRLAFGVEHYRRHELPRHAELYERLAPKQSPHTLFVTCADSRIQPSLLTSTDPGELFLLRNVGNMVPRWSAANPPSAGAGLEYAVGVLGVSAIVVCGHSRCGAIQALLRPEEIPDDLASVRAWADRVEAHAMCNDLPRGLNHDDVARMNALLQLEHVQSYPCVQARLEEGDLQVYAWFFDVATGEIEEWDAAERRWTRLGEPTPAVRSDTPPAPPVREAPRADAERAPTRAH